MCFACLSPLDCHPGTVGNAVFQAKFSFSMETPREVGTKISDQLSLQCILMVSDRKS